MALLHLWFFEMVNKHMLAVSMQAADASGIERLSAHNLHVIISSNCGQPVCYGRG